MQDLQLSKNFYLSEFLVSQTASRHKINNTPSQSAINNLTLLCEKVLQPIRDNFNQPVIISSGYRSPRLNDMVGGSKTSQHMTGQAADFYIAGMKNWDLAQWIHSNLNYDQLILEYYTGGFSGWVHVGYSVRHKNQELTINKRGTFNGLIEFV
jgi:zinc D-Ala-D-Ala carboxypeptidase